MACVYYIAWLILNVMIKDSFHMQHMFPYWAYIKVWFLFVLVRDFADSEMSQNGSVRRGQGNGGIMISCFWFIGVFIPNEDSPCCNCSLWQLVLYKEVIHVGVTGSTATICNSFPEPLQLPFKVWKLKSLTLMKMQEFRSLCCLCSFLEKIASFGLWVTGCFGWSTPFSSEWHI